MYPDTESFLKDTKDHELIINLDEGLYRDLTVKHPKTSSYHYNITTRPGFLMISGDMGCYVFKRRTDMFDFFRGQPDEINPRYWSEKIEAGEFQKYSPEKARSALNQEFENWKECTDFNEEQIAEEKNYLNQINTDDEFEFVDAIRNWVPNKDGVQLDDFWEHNTKEYTFHYIWCCYAIVHAIKLYDKAKSGGMNAIEFVKKFGWESAENILSCPPKIHQSYYLYWCNECGHGGSSEDIPVFPFNKDIVSCPKCHSDNLEDSESAFKDLKRLVDSWELINLCGGLSIAKELDRELISDNFEDIQKAIADLESIEGGDE